MYSTPTAEPPPMYDERGLPPGWSMGVDPDSGRPFYQDNLVTPPRIIYAHPFDDPAEVIHTAETSWTSYVRDESAPGYTPRDDVDGPSAASDPHAASHPQSSVSCGISGPKRRSSIIAKLGTLRDKVIGTKEEREAAYQERQLQQREMDRRYIERRNRAIAQRDAVLREMQSHLENIPGSTVGSYVRNSYVYGNPIVFRQPDQQNRR